MLERARQRLFRNLCGPSDLCVIKTRRPGHLLDDVHQGRAPRGPRAPPDPSFFIVHPSLAEYYQMKRIMALQEPATYVDDWARADHGEGSCLPATGGCLVSSSKDQPSEECCTGHYRYSTFFKDKMRTPASGDTPTNEEVIDAAHPANMGLDNLVFQHLRFDHCEEDFAALLDPHSRNEAPSTVICMTTRAAPRRRGA